PVECVEGAQSTLPAAGRQRCGKSWATVHGDYFLTHLRPRRLLAEEAPFATRVFALDALLDLFRRVGIDEEMGEQRPVGDVHVSGVAVVENVATGIQYIRFLTHPLCLASDLDTRIMRIRASRSTRTSVRAYESTNLRG